MKLLALLLTCAFACAAPSKVSHDTITPQVRDILYAGWVLSVQEAALTDAVRAAATGIKSARAANRPTAGLAAQEAAAKARQEAAWKQLDAVFRKLATLAAGDPRILTELHTNGPFPPTEQFARPATSWREVKWSLWKPEAKKPAL